MNDIAKKAVFLRRGKIELWLLVSLSLSGIVTVFQILYSIYVGHFEMFQGRFPLVVPVCSTVILFLIYAAFKSAVFELYDDLLDFVAFDGAASEAETNIQEVEITEDDMKNIPADVPISEVIEEISNLSTVEIVQETPVDESIDALTKNIDKTTEIKPTVVKSTQTSDDSARSDTTLADELTSFSMVDQLEEAFASAAIASPQQNVITKPTPKRQVNAASDSSVPVTERLSKEAKKALYKNKILQAMQERLDSVHSERNLDETMLQMSYATQKYISVKDMHEDSFAITIDDILFDE